MCRACEFCGFNAMKTTFNRRPRGISGSGIAKWRKAVAKGWRYNCGWSLSEMISRRERRKEVDVL
jgi:hypothetical protein